MTPPVKRRSNKWGPCSQPGCPTLTDQSRCDVHAPKPWAGSTRRKRLPGNWSTIARRVLARDRNRCYLCGDFAGLVDHVIAGDDHSMANLAAICKPCHGYKSGVEGATSPRRNRR